MLYLWTKSITRLVFSWQIKRRKILNIKQNSFDAPIFNFLLAQLFKIKKLMDFDKKNVKSVDMKIQYKKQYNQSFLSIIFIWWLITVALKISIFFNIFFFSISQESILIFLFSFRTPMLIIIIYFKIFCNQFYKKICLPHEQS